LACALTAPTSFLSGVLFTLIGDILEREIGQPTLAAAWLTLANTTGAMSGPPLAAFVLLPILGMERTIFIAAAVYAVIGLLVVRSSATLAAAVRSPLFVLSAIALVGALIRFPFGLMADRYFARAAAPYTPDGSDIVATREGASETIFLMQQKWLGRPVYSRLVTNGFSMTGTSVAGKRYMRYFAYWPMLLHQGPVRRALVVCYGLGITAGAVLDLPGLETLDIVELSRDVVSTSDIVYASNQHPLHDPRVRLHIEDGRYFLQASREPFDLITGEPPPPRTPGAVNIYTRDYFGLISDRLAEGGIATYWVPVGRPDPGTDVHTIIRAFCDVFDDCSLWNATPFDLMLVGTRHAAGPVSEAAFSAAWHTPDLGGRLREIGFEQPQQIGATFIGDSAYLRTLTERTPALTDDFPQRLRPVLARPSLSDPRYGIDRAVTELYRAVFDPARAQQAFLTSDFVRRLWPRTLIDGTRSSFAQQRIINQVLWEGGKPLRRIEDLHAMLTATTLQTLPLWQLGSDEVTQRIAEASEERSGAIEYSHGLRALVTRDYLRAAAHFGESERRGLQGATVRPLLVYSLCLAGDLDTARQLARRVDARDVDEQHFWAWMRATFGIDR
jgi:spermidine synthase